MNFLFCKENTFGNFLTASLNDKMRQNAGLLNTCPNIAELVEIPTFCNFLRNRILPC